MKRFVSYIDVRDATDTLGNPLEQESDNISALPFTYISNAIQIIIFLVGFAALGAIIYGGILYITSGGDTDKTARGRRSLTYGIIAIVLAMVSYLIYSTVVTKLSPS